jgi:hypothetical protein
MRRNSFLPDGALPRNPSWLNAPSRLALYDGAGGAGGGSDIPQEKVLEIGQKAVETYKAGLPKVPEKYDIKVPDKSLLPANAHERAAAIARTLNLTDNAHAQSIIDFANSELSSMATTTAKEHEEQVKKWGEEALKAPDLGNGKPDQLQAISARVTRLSKKYFPEAALKLLADTGLGNHPDFIRGFSKLADQAKEDLLETGSSEGGKKSIAERIYPSKAGTQ